jgi:hypothetical protein
MRRRKTHFEQVPLAIVKKIIRQQLLREGTPDLKSTSKEGYAETNRAEDQTKSTKGADF